VQQRLWHGDGLCHVAVNFGHGQAMANPQAAKRPIAEMLIAALQMHDGLQSRAIWVPYCAGGWLGPGGWRLGAARYLGLGADQPYRPRFPACNGIPRALLIPYTVHGTNLEVLQSPRHA
jgi:hypothetical protein